MRRRTPTRTLHAAPVDAWLALLATHASTSSPEPLPQPDTPAAAARADAIALAVSAMTDAHGRPVGVRALRRRQGGGDVEVVVSAPVAVPAGWRRVGDQLCGLVVPEDAPVDRSRADGRAPVLVAFDGPDRTVVGIDLGTVGWLTVPSAWLAPVGDAIVRSGLVRGLDVVLFGVAPGELLSAGARVHLASDVEDLEHLVGQLVGDDEPVVVVASGADAAVLRCVQDLGAAVVSDGDGLGARASVVAAGGRWRLDPPGWPVDAVRPPAGFAQQNATAGA